MVAEFMRRYLKTLIKHKKRKMQNLGNIKSDEYYTEFIIYDILVDVLDYLEFLEEIYSPPQHPIYYLKDNEVQH